MIKLAERVAWREIDGEVVLLDVAAGKYVSVNQTGAALWPLITGGATEAELADALVDRYAVERDRAAADVRAFVDWLRAERLVTEPAADAQR